MKKMNIFFALFVCGVVSGLRAGSEAAKPEEKKDEELAALTHISEVIHWEKDEGIRAMAGIAAATGNPCRVGDTCIFRGADGRLRKAERPVKGSYEIHDSETPA